MSEQRFVASLAAAPFLGLCAVFLSYYTFCAVAEFRARRAIRVNAKREAR